MRDINFVLALVVIILLVYQVNPALRLPATRPAKLKLNDADWAVCVFTLILALLVAVISLSI